MNTVLGLLHIALIQYPVQGGLSIEAFQNKVNAHIAQAKNGGAELVVFPELISSDLNLKDEEVAKNYTLKYFEWLKNKSKETNMIILGGSFPRLETDGFIRNTAAMAFPDGRLLLQDKLFLTPGEREAGWKQGTELKLNVDKKLGRFVITICYDSEFPQISEKYAAFKPHLVLIPSMTGKPGLNRVRFAALARAVENYAYVAVTGTLNEGQAMVVPPQDENFVIEPVMGKLNVDEPLITTLDLKKVDNLKPMTGVYPARDVEKFPNPIKVVPGVSHKAHPCSYPLAPNETLKP